MPTYNNPINFASGFKIGAGVPIDDRYIFNNLADATLYVTGGFAFFVYEGLWIYIVDPGAYYYVQRANTGLPWDSLTNPYQVIDYAAQFGGLPALGQANQQLVVDPSGGTAIYDYFNQKGLIRFVGAALANPSIVEGMFVQQPSGNAFLDIYTPGNYPLNTAAKLPLYFVFKIDGNDLIMGKQGIFNSPNHNVTQRQLLYLRGSYTTTQSTYYSNVMSTTANSVDGQYNIIVGNAIDTDNIFIDLTHDWDIVGASPSGAGNATIERSTIQRAGSGGIPESPDGFFTVPHGFGDQQGVVQVVALNSTPPPYPGGSGNILVTVDTVSYETGSVRLKLDYGVLDPSLIFQVILIF